MGFWDVTKRMIQGKPAFEAPPSDDDWDDDRPTDEFAEEREAKRAEAEDTGLHDEHGYKHIPTVNIIHVRSDLSGQHIDLWATIKNTSDRDLFLDKITPFGTRFELKYPLKPHDQRVFRIYSGPQLTHDHYKKAELYYKDTQSGDYFRADNLVKYHYDANGTYEVVGFESLSPIVDV